MSFAAVPLIPAILAVVFASSSRKRIAASGGTLTGESLCTVALVLGWINIGLSVLAGIFGLVLLFAWARDMDMIDLAPWLAAV